MTLQELFNKADDYKKIIDESTPLQAEQLAKLNQESSDSRPEAYDYMLSGAKSESLIISEDIIKRLHFLLYEKMNQDEAGQYRKPLEPQEIKEGNVIQKIQETKDTKDTKETKGTLSGSKQMYPMPEELPHFMGHFINQMESSKNLLHPIEFAAICHKRLMDIHPFEEGNGKVARLLMNLILVNAGYPVTSIPPVLHNEYRNALKASQGVNNPDIDGFIKLITECVIEAEHNYCRLI